MKIVDLSKRMALVLSPVLLAQTGAAHADTAERLAVCKTELKALYGEETRVRMYGHQVLPRCRDAEVKGDT